MTSQSTYLELRLTRKEQKISDFFDLHLEKESSLKNAKPNWWIAEQVGCSVSTVFRYIKKMKLLSEWSLKGTKFKKRKTNRVASITKNNAADLFTRVNFIDSLSKSKQSKIRMSLSTAYKNIIIRKTSFFECFPFHSYYTNNNNIKSCKNFKQTVDNSDSVQSFSPQTWTPISSNFIPNEENMKRIESKENVDTNAIINNFIRYNRRRGSKSMDWNLSFKGWIDNPISWRYKEKSTQNKSKVTKAQGFTNHTTEVHPTYHDKTGIFGIERERSSEYKVSNIGSECLQKIKNLLTGRGRQQNE